MMPDFGPIILHAGADALLVLVMAGLLVAECYKLRDKIRKGRER
jgi:hypothetical protein